MVFLRFLLIVWCWIALHSQATAEPVTEEIIAEEIIAPYSLGEPTDIEGVWDLLNGSGQPGGYVIASETLAPLPGFGGHPLNLLVLLDYEGNFIDVKLLSQNEPIFVSGLGEAPLRSFLEQYRGQSVNTPMTVGTQYGKGSNGSLVFLDGVTKATASVRVAHESIIAAAREVAKQKLKGFGSTGASASPKLDYEEDLNWQQIVDEGIARRFTTSHEEVRRLFEGTLWADDDPFPERADDAPYADLWVVDIGAPSIARAVLEERALDDLERLREIAPDDEPILLIEAGDHGLVSKDFVRNTTPGLITAKQDGLPITLRDADLQIELKEDLPEGVAMVLRADRRLGFDPVRPWEIGLIAKREHGMFQPEIGEMELSWDYQAPPRFYEIEEAVKPVPPWKAAIFNRAPQMMALMFFLAIGFIIMAYSGRAVKWRYFSLLRVSYLALTLVFVGWIGQGQLSIVTPLAVIRALTKGQSLDFLLYDPFSLLIWIVVIVSFFLWGRALYCGWLCPFGAFQELIQKAAERLGIKLRSVPERVDHYLKWGKYLSLGALLLVFFWQPAHVDKAAEVEPFKTAISVIFERRWYFVAYAVFWLVICIWIPKAFCRYLCPLGAVMAIGGVMQLRPWIKRRALCGSPCQLCKVRCDYQSIKSSGAIVYSECLGCLECVDIYEDPKTCVAIVLQSKKEQKS